MRGKLLFITGAAVGYVLGARAGRKRYEQIKSAATKVWESPGIQRQVGQIEDFAAARIGDIPGALYIVVKKVVTAGSRGREASGTTPAVTSRSGESSGPVRKDSGSGTSSSGGSVPAGSE